MKNNQFAIQPVSTHQKIAELTQLGFLDDQTDQLTATELWYHFLRHTMLENPSEAGWHAFLTQTLATSDLTLAECRAQQRPVSRHMFQLVALQLLAFEVDVDYDPAHPDVAWRTIQLPALEHALDQPAAIIDAWYLLLCTHTKNGQSFIDALTSRGFLVPLYQLPATQKPLFFNGKALAVFDPTQLINEVVYVETDLDTDSDGQRDLIKVEITRPAETNDGLQIPAVYTASPYNQGTNDAWGEKMTHSVATKLTHKDPQQQPDIPAFPTPTSHRSTHGETTTAEETVHQQATYTLNNYLAVRGFAIIYSAGIGTKDSDGFQTCGSPEQTLATIAVIEWLNGQRRAFTNRTDQIEISAWWCSGNVAMTGRSYLGTLATAAATTGVTGLKTIISEAAISSWYDYYRENGLVMAPGGFPGEDADVLAAETFSRTKNAGDYHHVQAAFNDYLQQMARAMDRATGNYNDFWRQRNYRPNIKNIQADIMMVHGLNDWNVKLNQVKRLWDGLADLPVARKLVLHQGQHIYINAFRSIDFTDIVNLWLSNKLWQVDNHANDVLPDLIAQDNVVPETWTSTDQWEQPGHARQWQLTTDGLRERAAATTDSVTFNDQLPVDQFQTFSLQPAVWQTALVTTNNAFSCQFKTPQFKDDLLLQGTPELTVSLTASADHGMLSAQLVDYGTARRFNVSPTMLNRQGLELGYHWQKDDLREFTLADRPSDYHVISFGHINLQNRHSSAQIDALAAGQRVALTLKLQPIFHHLAAGHRLGLVLFSTDFGMTVRGNEAITYRIELGESHLVIPTVR